MTGSGLMTVEQKRMEEAAQRAAQRAVNQLRMSRRTLRAGAGQVTRMYIFCARTISHPTHFKGAKLSRMHVVGCSACRTLKICWRIDQ